MVIGITGGIGAGKSTVIKYMREHYSVYTILADDVARQLQNPGSSIYFKMIELFGKEILLEDGNINRQRVAELVFSDKAKLKQLNAIVHPIVRTEIVRQIRKQQSSYEHIAVEAALLVEEHYDDICDEIWYIDARKDIRIKRLMDSRGYDKGHCERIMAGQLSKEEFKRACDITIDNSGDMEYLKKQLSQLLGRNKDAGSI